MGKGKGNGYNPTVADIRRSELLPIELGGVNYNFKREPRCLVCKAGDEIVFEVNSLLTQGLSYAAVLRSLSSFNTSKLHKADKISYQSIRTHYMNHVKANEAAVREIIERRSAANHKNFIEGVENLVEPKIYAEAMMTKAFQQMSGADIGPMQGLAAARQLYNFTKDEEGQESMSDALWQLNKIIEAVRTVVPPAMWQQIVDRLEVAERPAIEGAVEEGDVLGEDPGDPDLDEEAYDPVEEGVDRDDFETG